jgi:perosamine synthetase
MIHLFYPYIPDDAVAQVLGTLNSRWVGQAHKVDEFEKLFDKTFKQEYSVALNSGSSALETAYDLLELKPGDEVISTPLTCTATNIPLLRRGVKIVWADIDPGTLCLSRDDVLSRISSKTKAIVNVHLGGVENDLWGMPCPVVSDACQALGVFKGDYTCNSFQAIKHITTGDGGMITLPNEDMCHKAKLLRWFGIDREKKQAANWSPYTLTRKMTFDIELLGHKRQMTDIAAGMGIAGLEGYADMINARYAIADIYKERLGKIAGVKLIDGKVNTWWLCTLIVREREKFSKMLYANSIDNNMVQVRNDIYKIFGGKRQDLPILNSLEENYVSIPLHPFVTEDMAHFICDCIEGGW